MKNKPTPFFALLISIHAGGFNFSGFDMLSEGKAANSNLCAAELNAPEVLNFNLRDAEVRLDRGKRDRANQSAQLDHVLHNLPFAAIAGPRVVEFAVGRTLDQISVRLTDNQTAFSLPRVDFPGHIGEGSADGRYVILWDGVGDNIFLLDLTREKVTLKIRSPAGSVDEDLTLMASFSAGGKYLNVRSPNGVQSFDLRGKAPLLEAEFGMSKMEDDEMRARRGYAHYLPEYQILVQHYLGGALRMLRPFGNISDIEFEETPRAGRGFFGLSDARGRKLFAVRQSRYIDIFSLPGRKLLRTLIAAHEINLLALSPNGKYLAYSSYPGEVIGVFDLTDERSTESSILDLPEFAATMLAFGSKRELLFGNWSLAEAYAFLLQ